MKKIIAVLISLGLLASFSGCGNSESQTELTCFVHADIFSYMFLKNQFVFFDFEQSAVSVFAEYTAMMSFWASAHLAYGSPCFATGFSEQSFSAYAGSAVNGKAFGRSDIPIRNNELFRQGI